MPSAARRRGDPPPDHELTLRQGEQVLVNGALLTAAADCTIRISAAASVIPARAGASAAPGADPAPQLYYAALEALGSGLPPREIRMALAEPLAQAVAHYRTRAAQAQCAAFAAALLAMDVEAMLAAARSLARGETLPPRPLRCRRSRPVAAGKGRTAR